MGERQSIAPKGGRAIVRRRPQLEMAKVLQKPMFVLPACQQVSVNTLLRDNLGLAEKDTFLFCALKPGMHQTLIQKTPEPRRGIGQISLFSTLPKLSRSLELGSRKGT